MFVLLLGEYSFCFSDFKLIIEICIFDFGVGRQEQAVSNNIYLTIFMDFMAFWFTVCLHFVFTISTSSLMSFLL